MSEPPTEFDTLMEELGGMSALAAALGVGVSAVVNWRTRGVPARQWAAIVELARERGAERVTFERLAAMEPAEARA